MTTPQQDEWHFAEEIGQLFESMGGSRMAGRVWGTLLVAAEPELTSADFQERLRASAGSISASTRLLTEIGVIDRVRRPGERRDYFRMRPGGLDRLIHQRMAIMDAAVRMMDRGLDQFGDREHARTRLEDTRDFYAWYARELPALHERWEQEHRGRGEETTR